MKLVIFSICLNEEKTLGEVLDRMPKKIEGVDEIVKFVVDDGSTDKTVEVAKKHGAVVYSNGRQKKLAYSFQLAVEKVLAMDADIAVNIDGDLQFIPEEIPSLVQPILEGKADFVAGNRFPDGQRPKNMPFSKYIGNKFGAYILSKLTKMKFYDVTAGFRAYNRETLLSMNINNKFTYTQEAFQLLASKNFNIAQVPITMEYFPGRKSRVVTSISYYVFTSAFNIFRSFKDFAPIQFFGFLGIIPMILGLACLIFMSIHWLNTGVFFPYKFVGFAGIYLFTFGLLMLIFGVLSDMLGKMLSNQEKLLYYSKKAYFEEKAKKNNK